MLISGCGASDRASVSGTLVRHDGAPLVGARVIARSAETGKSAYGTTDAAGRFELGISNPGDGAPPGNYGVVVIEDHGDSEIAPRPTISKKYLDPSTSGLSLSLEAGESAVLDAKLDPP